MQCSKPPKLIHIPLRIQHVLLTLLTCDALAASGGAGTSGADIRCMSAVQVAGSHMLPEALLWEAAAASAALYDSAEGYVVLTRCVTQSALTETAEQLQAELDCRTGHLLMHFEGDSQSLLSTMLAKAQASPSFSQSAH